MRTYLLAVLLGALDAVFAAAQPMGHLGLPVADAAREKAFQVKMGSLFEAPLTVVLTYDPGCHPESRIVIRVRSRTRVDVELIRASLSSRAALERLEETGKEPVNQETLIALMGVTRVRGAVDAGVAMWWLKHLRSAAVHELAKLEEGAYPHPSYTFISNGTEYTLHYRGQTSFTATVGGCEVPCASRADSPLVKWMNIVWEQVNSMLKQPAEPVAAGADAAAR
ncbi:MAG: hypothetical protein ABSH46_08705 [Bryobacteraceae bacterium]|jgi:hypothetical protein